MGNCILWSTFKDLRVSCKSFLSQSLLQIFSILCILKAQLLLVYFVFTVTAPSERFYLYKRMEIQVAAEAVSRQEEDDLLRAVMRNRLSVS